MDAKYINISKRYTSIPVTGHPPVDPPRITTDRYARDIKPAPLLVQWWQLMWTDESMLFSSKTSFPPSLVRESVQATGTTIIPVYFTVYEYLFYSVVYLLK